MNAVTKLSKTLSQYKEERIKQETDLIMQIKKVNMDK